VDRYIVWPGQALAYKLGQLKIRELRTEAERKLGAKFVPETGFGFAITVAGGATGLPLPSLQNSASPVPSMKWLAPVPPWND